MEKATTYLTVLFSIFALTKTIIQQDQGTRLFHPY